MKRIHAVIESTNPRQDNTRSPNHTLRRTDTTNGGSDLKKSFFDAADVTGVIVEKCDHPVDTNGRAS